MADILLNSDNNDVTLNFTFNSPQQFYFTVAVIDSTGKQIFHDTGTSSTKTSFNLGAANGLIGLYLTISWVVIDPAGAGNKFFGNATAFQNAIAKNNKQICAGITTNTYASANTMGQFNSI